MKKFVIRLVHFLPIPFLIIGINYFVDPANLFQNGKFESGIADYLTRGYNVTNVANFDERLLQKYIIEKSSECPSIIALGASRIMMINQDHFINEKFINNGVSGATLEDYLAILNLYEKKGCKIKKVIIDLEPYLLNDNHSQSRWMSLEKDCWEMTRKISLKWDRPPVLAHKLNKFKELFSISYFRNSVENLINDVSKVYQPTDITINTSRTRIFDGSITYSSEERHASLELVEQKAKNIISINPLYSMEGFYKLSPKYSEVLEKLIDYLLSKNVKIEFYLFPYHPIVYDHLVSNGIYKSVFEAESYFINLAEANSINIVGSFNPKYYKFDNSYFYDGYHCNEKAISIILE